jgi:hypothetical protein
VGGKTRRPGAPGSLENSLRTLASDRTLGSSQTLGSDQRGAIMVIGIFIAMMLVGMIYYVWGIGGAILFRERMQDASDASAFSAAVIHARAMNIIAVINIIMAALAAIETGLQVARDMILTSAIAAGITCAFCGPWCAFCCQACPYAVAYGINYNSARNIHSTAEDLIDPIINDILNPATQIIEQITPATGIAFVVAYSQSPPYSPPVDLGALVPAELRLQAENDDTDWPCDNKVFLPALLIGELVAPIEISFNFSLWYLAGVASGPVFAFIYAREWCPDVFQRVTDGSMLGMDEFQMRSVMHGQSQHRWTRQGVSMADWGRSDGSSSVFDALEIVTQFSFAQAEYYYHQPSDGDHDREEYMWHQRWRARLRRFRMPSGGGGDVAGAAGDGGGLLEQAMEVVVH